MSPTKEADMELYAGIDLHSNNSVVSVLDEQDRTVYAKRLPNDLGAILAALRACAGTLRGVAVESTFNWYWLVDGLQAAGFTVHLVNTAAVRQYDGLKHGGDFSDARHLAHLLRLGILPVGYIYPREERAVRDLLRKRSQLVRQRTSQILSIENLMARNLGARVGGNEVKRWDAKCIDAMELLDEQKQALKANLVVMNCIDGEVVQLERRILAKVKLRKDFKALKTVSGIGEILALTIALETGDIGRFAGPGNFASYARMVWTAAVNPTARRRVKEMPSAATSTWRGHSSRRRTSRCATTRRSSAGTRRSAPAACPSWPSRRWRTSWRGPATT